MLTKLKKILSNSVYLTLLIVVMVGMLLIGFDLFHARHYTMILINKIKALFGMKTTNTSGKNYTEADGKAAIEAVKSVYGVDMARVVEKVFRHETRHFQSEQYKQTGTPGLVVGKWPAPVPTAPTVTFKVDPKKEAGGRSQLDFVVWSPKECALFLAAYITKYSGNYARWFSTDANLQAKYRAAVEKIKPRFV